jgi:hypothetical protein
MRRERCAQCAIISVSVEYLAAVQGLSLKQSLDWAGNTTKFPPSQSGLPPSALKTLVPLRYNDGLTLTSPQLSLFQASS